MLTLLPQQGYFTPTPFANLTSREYFGALVSSIEPSIEFMRHVLGVFTLQTSLKARYNPLKQARLTRKS